METALMISLIVIGFLVSLAGLAGCVLPFLPGPPLNFLALLILSLARDWQPFGVTFLVIMGVLALLVTVLDYFFPGAGARKYGASKYGVWGSVLGLILGLVIFSAPGMFLGGLLGAFVGELMAGKHRDEAFRAGWGAFIGNLFGIGVKMGLSGVMFFFYIKEMF